MKKKSQWKWSRAVPIPRFVEPRGLSLELDLADPIHQHESTVTWNTTQPVGINRVA